MADHIATTADSAAADGARDGATFITRVVLENYKSIAYCDVRLGPLTFLVGRNGAGKSNFLDALRFLQESTSTTLDNAVRARGGIEDLICRTNGHPTSLTIRVEFVFPYGHTGFYVLQLGVRSFGGYEILREVCEVVTGPATDVRPTRYLRNKDTLVESPMLMPTLPLQPDRLALVAASADSTFRAVYDGFTLMGFYHIDPYRIRDPQPPSAAPLLAADGSNAASILARLGARAAGKLKRVEEYLSLIVPGVRTLRVKTAERRETIEFGQRATGRRTQHFTASSMSDGTLHALGVLLALFQVVGDGTQAPKLVGIEEPELALHPLATAVLRDALRDASADTQVLATSHSPDLLNDRDLDADVIRVVWSEQGVTTIGPLDAASRRILEEQLFTAGELTRRMELRPAPVGAAPRSGAPIE
jgi:predicted ATPase